MADEELIGEFAVCSGSEAVGVVLEDRFAMGGSFADADRAGDDVLIDFVGEIVRKLTARHTIDLRMLFWAGRVSLWIR